MKTHKLTLVIVLLGFGSFVSAQDYAFKVLANKGTNEVKSGDAWQPLKTGASLKSTDEVKLADNAYIGLVHSSGKPLELKQAGNYKISELSAKIGGGSSVLNKYTDFILSSNSAEAKKNRLSATGAVHRAAESHMIKLILPEDQFAQILNNTAVINWEDSKTGPYVVTFLDMFDEELAKVETPENTYTVDLSSPKLAAANIVYVIVNSKADPKQVSKRHMIKKLSAADQAKIKKSISELGEEATTQNALNKFIMAGFYEQNNLLIDAITAYEEAIKMAPDVPTYKESYEEFLLRHTLKK